MLSRKNANLKQQIKRGLLLQKGRNDVLLKLDVKNNKPAFNFSLKSGLTAKVEPLLVRSDLKANECGVVVKFD